MGGDPDFNQKSETENKLRRKGGHGAFLHFKLEKKLYHIILKALSRRDGTKINVYKKKRWLGRSR